MSAPSVSEATRQQYEQVRLRRAVTVLQALVGILSVAVVGLVVGLSQVEDRLRDNAAEVHALRESIQKVFETNLPLLRQINSELEQASGQASSLNKSLEDGGAFQSRVDEAIRRANQDIPKSFEAFFAKDGARLVADAVAAQSVQDASRKQAAEALKQAMDDPEVERKAEDRMTKVIGKAFDNALAPKQGQNTQKK